MDLNDLKKKIAEKSTDDLMARIQEIRSNRRRSVKDPEKVKVTERKKTNKAETFLKGLTPEQIEQLKKEYGL